MSLIQTQFQITRNQRYSPNLVLVRPSPGDFLLSGIEVKTAEMKQDVCLEALDVTIAIGFLDQGLDLIIEPFDGAVG